MQPTPPDLPPYDNPPLDVRVRALLCADDKGQVQVVAPEDALIDPEPLRETTARNLRTLPQPEQGSVCAIPGFYGLPSVVHSSLKEHSVMALATETPGQYVRATGAELHQMCQNHASFEAEFCERLQCTPGDPAHDEENIHHAIETFTARRIEARLDETLVIPPLPETARRIIELQQDPSLDLNALVAIIEADPSISARVMGWANSAFYGASTPSKTLNDAIMRVLGFDLVFNMALGLAIGDSLNVPKSHVSGASPYWLDAVYSGAIMEALAQKVSADRRPNPGTCYLAGLLSNFGTLVIGHVFPPQYATICQLQEANPDTAYPFIDQHVLLVNREVIAATLLELWELPDEITTAVRFQNVADYSGAHASYVHLLTLSQELLRRGPAQLDENCQKIVAELGITAKDLQEISMVISQSQDELGELAQTISS
jgi:HD-like signal output (HDOD) protein